MKRPFDHPEENDLMGNTLFLYTRGNDLRGR